MIFCKVIRVLCTRGIPRLFCLTIRTQILLGLVAIVYANILIQKKIVYANRSPISLSRSFQSELKDAKAQKPQRGRN